MQSIFCPPSETLCRVHGRDKNEQMLPPVGHYYYYRLIFKAWLEWTKHLQTAWNRPTWKVMVVVPSCSHWRALKRRDTLYSRLWSRADRAQVFGSLWVIGHDANLFLFGVQCIYPPFPSLHRCNILLSFVSELLLANPSPSTIFSPAQWQDIPVSVSSNVDEIQCPILHNPFLSWNSHKLKGTVTHFVKKKKKSLPWHFHC